MMFLAATAAQAQITIAGNVYGGGNAGDTGESTTVTVRAGDINAVFGGARLADVGGSVFVNIDGEHASDFIVINKVYGGNDVAGRIGTSATIPTELISATDDGVDNTWNAFVRISTKTTTDTDGKVVAADDAQRIYIGQLFGGGNGDYIYTHMTDGNVTTHYIKDKTGTPIASNTTGFRQPELGKTYLDLQGGSIVYAYGGGNNATVTGATVISVNNPSKVVNSIKDKNDNEVLTSDRFKDQMGINTGFSYPSSDAFQIGRLFGGNNMAEMDIRPTWKLKRGLIRNLYSGGNQGAMTHPNGISLAIRSEGIKVDNVYGGCRMADVNPAKNTIAKETIDGVPYPAGYAARVIITAGDINNVYGGNDITGNVYGGNAVGIHCSIRGDVYGGGNGSYPYTDNWNLKDDDVYGDLYYGQRTTAYSSFGSPALSIEALNAFRPNAEAVSIRLIGTAAKPTVIGGAVYCGGNSATLRNDSDADAAAELKIGSYVYADNVFFGNNGENMIKYNDKTDTEIEGVLKTYTKYVTTDLNGQKVLTDTGTDKFTTLNMKDATIFGQFMDGVAMRVRPRVVFDISKTNGGEDDADYIPYSTYFGSLFGGGNIGSMKFKGEVELNFNKKVVIFEKFVGGCNNAFVPVTEYNALYEGGVLENPNTTTGNKLVLNLSGLKIEPKRWNSAYTALADNDNLVVGNKYYTTALGDGEFIATTTTKEAGKTYYQLTNHGTELVWNTISAESGLRINPNITPGALTTPVQSTRDDLDRRLTGGNIYGGCYNSGIVNGNVVININETLMEREKLFDEVESDELGEEVSLYGEDQTTETQYQITTRHTGVILGQQGMDVLGKALNVFGGGFGKDSQIWGSTTINLNKGYVFQIFGGSEKGVIGKSLESIDTSEGGNYQPPSGAYEFNGLHYQYSPTYSCYVNLKGDFDGVSKKENNSDDMAECEFMYGGGFFGPIVGNTHVNLGSGRIFNSFAGSCNADILGHTETYIGRMIKDEYQNVMGAHVNDESAYVSGFPWIRDYTYGGNDLGGIIMREEDFVGRVRDDVKGMVHRYNATSNTNPDVVKASAYTEYLQGRAIGIFGGCYGTYDYTDRYFEDYTNEEGEPINDFTKPRLNNAFVNFRPSYSNENNMVEQVFGAGQGYSGEKDRDIMQNRSYVLIDIPQSFGSKYEELEVFGAGAWGGVGMGVDLSGENPDKDKASAIIDLARGTIGATYGASYKEGVTYRTLVNVPDGSTINIGSIFGGAYGTETLLPCDVYEANVEYHSANACMIYNPVRTVKENDPETGEEVSRKVGNEKMKGAIYGGNNQERRTIYGRINIDVPINQNHYQYGSTKAYVYGAGYGPRTWSEYTEINLNSGAEVYEVYGGGEAGRVLNAESVQKYMNSYISSKPDGITKPSSISDDDYNNHWDKVWKAAWTLGGGLDPENFTITADGNSYLNNTKTNLSNPLARTAEIDDRQTKTYKYNTNVIIHQGAYVGNYAYGGGLGKEGTGMEGSGDVYGTTYIALLGGEVSKDIYAAGTLGAVYDAFGAGNFTAGTTAYIAGGTLRNVYGGGWKGDVGYTTMTVSEPDANGWTTATFDDENERPGETHVVIGIRKDQTDENLETELKKVAGVGATKNSYGIYAGLPAIQRNAYSGGEGGAVFGTANLTLNNGYIGYGYSTDSIAASSKYGLPGGYYPMIEDKTYKVNNIFVSNTRLVDCGNMFGGGYDVRSSVDFTNVKIWNGVVRNSVHGGGEIATIGRGAVTPSGKSNSVRSLNGFYKSGKTNIEMYNGHVQRNVFGGGKGYNLYGYGQEGTLYTDGYVFGQTEVHIHGGEVGTDEGLADGYGNVFGGGDIGYVYGPGITSEYTKQKISTNSPGHIYYYNERGVLEEDCKVVVSPWLQKKTLHAETFGTQSYDQYEYVKTEDLNYLPKKDDDGHYTGGWEKLYTGVNKGVENPTDDDTEERGVIIHNAVFGGGNVSSNSDQSYANTTTVYGNTTVTLNDIFHRDFITVGTEHTGGIYGGGNLSVVDGYRELNITNYGTDYYGLKQTISIDEYRDLSNRERAYFQLEYKCTATSETNEGKTGVTIDGTFYETGKKLTEEEYLKLANNENTEIANLAKSSFEPYGFCSIYAGRLLNTIQRADLCGVFGSRMVLQGAKDRVAEVGEDIAYTINRVGELSLNQQRSTDGNTIHGNYFGIYSLVNYLGNLTSDVHFSDPYRNKDGEEETGKTYYSYKSANHTSSDRNKGQSFNQVALASGVFLELTTEETEIKPNKEKVYGYVTGVIELDLINVKRDQVGGGFVYAKNEHRVPRRYPNKQNVILSQYNKFADNEACTYKQFRYDKNETTGWVEDGSAFTLGYPETDHEDHDFGETKEWQTSGNFIHHEKRIVDDCYPTNNAYVIGSANYSEAHYWYVKGDVYIYEQKVSAYTGSANAYSKEVHLPLTITAASHGQLQLLNVKPNLYAYYTDKNGERVKLGTNGSDGKPIDKVTVNNESDTYKLNDVISWWDWHQMTPSDRRYFVANTYVNCVTCQVDGVTYEAGTYVMDDTDFNTFQGGTHVLLDASGEPFEDGFEVFRSSNNISHETGYVLTFDMNSPQVWDDYYTKVNSTEKISKAAYEALLDAAATDADKQAVINAWREGPTFTPMTSGVYGKREYKAGDIITEAAFDNAPDKSNMEKAYVATTTVTYTYAGTQKTMNPGAAISKTEFDAIGTAQSSFAPALFVTNTVKLSKDDYMLYGELKTSAEITAIKAAINADTDMSSDDKVKLNNEIEAALTPAYILTANGTFGGQQFDAGNNYGAIEAWCSLSSTDRANFNYNYDALDLLVSSPYLAVNTEVTSSPDHSSTVTAFHEPYTNEVKVEYQAVYVGDEPKEIHYENSTTIKSFTKDTPEATIMNTEYETIRNDKKHYAHIVTTKPDEMVYITKENFVYLGVPYGIGQVVDKDVYDANTSCVELVTIATSGEWYYCYENYGGGSQKGTFIDKGTYGSLTNDQQYFIIQGKEPTETTTLYVSRESNAYDVMKEKIITVVYQYTYNEDEDDGSVKKTNELHVINIHLQLESGAPIIGQLQDPPLVLPGNAVGLSRPDVNPGLYEVLNSGWELFSTPDDAINHRNGVPFENNSTPVYWYQNQKNWVAFYSRTWLGKAYSNSVPLSVANYHDLDAVMKDKEHHMYVDRSDVDRDCKIYIDNRECESDPDKSELDLLKDFFDLSVLDSSPAADSELAGHSLLGNHVRSGRHLEFFLSSNVSPKKYKKVVDGENVTGPGWTSIGNNNDKGETGGCFEGTLHGDGYTISGLSSSLFAHLCGEVYNLGVTGTFKGAGIAETGDGYVENCWIKTTGTPDKVDGEDHYAVFANPSRIAGDERGQVQVENCYYPESNDYQTPSATDYAHGKPRQMPDKDFYNGEVAYNLNGFYLHKRYYHGKNLSSGTSYQYLQPNADGTLPEEMTTGYYPNTYAIYQPDIKVAEGETKPYMGYVENRFYDGDYRYAGGSIPEGADIRVRTVTTTVGTGDEAVEKTDIYYVPIWPDDYIFFGQALTYGHIGNRVHQSYPSHINKSNDRILMTQDGNRVYRAPAYFRSKHMDVAHFNPYAVFSDTHHEDPSIIAYQGMTAIDFTGGNGDVANGYKEGWSKEPWNGDNDIEHFYLPLLDDDGITDFQNHELTRNLLVYTKAGTTTDAVVSACEAMADKVYEETNSTYRTVAMSDDPWTKSVKGHWVQLTSENKYVAQRDHFLVDKEDFNCPIAYQFNPGSNIEEGKRMWYQRDPQDMRYVDRTKGWEAISLPFETEIVTTPDKGELTHFYQGSTTGHEYWLRELDPTSRMTLKKDEHDADIAGVYIADFNPLAAGSNTKDYTNTFLWDYYYSHDDNANQDVDYDKNMDEYQKTYYKTGHEYTDYPYPLVGRPYIVGFPGSTYYEFDLSGDWTPKNRYQNGEIESKGKQIITFASVPGETIGVSDDEMVFVTEKDDADKGYTFRPTYLNNPSIAENTDVFLLDSDGDSFDKTAADAIKITAFRPYFTSPAATGSARQTRGVEQIIFGQSDNKFGVEERGDPRDDEAAGTLNIYAKCKKIVVESNLREITDVRIVNMAGITVNTFSIEPGETVETRINNAGVYIVQTADTRYTKKLAVR